MGTLSDRLRLHDITAFSPRPGSGPCGSRCVLECPPLALARRVPLARGHTGKSTITLNDGRQTRPARKNGDQRRIVGARDQASRPQGTRRPQHGHATSPYERRAGHEDPSCRELKRTWTARRVAGIESSMPATLRRASTATTSTAELSGGAQRSATRHGLRLKILRRKSAAVGRGSLSTAHTILQLWHPRSQGWVFRRLSAYVLDVENWDPPGSMGPGFGSPRTAGTVKHNSRW